MNELDRFIRVSEVLLFTSFSRTILWRFPEVSPHKCWSKGLANIRAGGMARRPRTLEKPSMNRFPPTIE